MSDNLPASVDSRVPAGTDPSFLGTGFAWPFGVDATGSIAMAGSEESVESAITLVLMTAPGERLMRPGFGCSIWDMLYEPVNATLLGRMRDAVYRAVTQWEPRVDVLDVIPLPDPENHALVHIGIEYVLKQNNDRRNLVYPFYLIPHDAEE